MTVFVFLKLLPLHQLELILSLGETAEPACTIHEYSKSYVLGDFSLEEIKDGEWRVGDSHSHYLLSEYRVSDTFMSMEVLALSIRDTQESFPEWSLYSDGRRGK